MRRKHRKKRIPWLLYTVLVALVISIGSYLFGTYHFSSHFLPGTFVNHINVENMTTKEANQAIKNELEKGIYRINEKNQTVKALTLKDFDDSLDFQKELSSLLKKQVPWSFPIAFIHPKKASVGEFKVSAEEIDKYLATLKPELENLNKQRTPTKDATLALVDGKIQIQPEVVGDAFTVDKVLADFKKNIEEEKEVLQLENYYVQPTITKDDETLQTELQKAEKIVNVKGGHTIFGTKVEIPKETLMSWITLKDGKVALDEKKVTAYVTELGKKYNTSEHPYTLSSTKRGQVSVPAGTYGWSVNVPEETKALTADVLKGEDFDRTLIVKGIGNIKDPRIGKSYIEVDLQNQHMWYYKDGKLALETPVVTGKPSTSTPPGIFYIWNKETNATLRGPNGDGTNYETPVNYWMPIDWTGVGIHDANWQPKFGGDWYLKHGSHGCVNTPPKVMAQLFSMVTENTPVLIF